MQRIAKKKSAKPSKAQIARARAYINSMDWQFAKTMPQWPHWYVLREDGRAREFDFVKRLIKQFGYRDPWGSRTKYSFVMGRFKYWVDDDVLNRGAPLSNAEVRKRGETWLIRHRMKIGPYGRPIVCQNEKKTSKEKMKRTTDTWQTLRERVYDLGNTRSDMTIRQVKRAVAKFLRDDITSDQIHFTPKGVYLCKECRRKTNVNTLKDLI